MSVREQIRQYVVDALLSGDGRGFTDETDLIDSGILDSFATTELVAFLEETFQVKLGSDKIGPGQFRSIDALAKLVEEARKNLSQ